MIRDEGLPVSGDTLAEARRTLSYEFGYKIVNETGRNVLLVRVPRARPDYLHDLEGAAQYVDLETLGNVKDVILVGDEKVTRMDPLPLRDHVKSRRAEDAELIAGLLKRLGSAYEVTTFKHQGKVPSTRLAVRIPRPSVSMITPEDIDHIREVCVPALEAPGGSEVSVFYVIADNDFERLPRATFSEIAGIAPPPPPPQPVAAAPAVAYAAPPAASVPIAPAVTPAPAMPAAAAAAPAAPVTAQAINEDTELYVSKKPAPAKPAGGKGKAPVDDRPVRQQVEEDPNAKILHASDEYVVYTSSKPKSGPDPEFANKPFLLSDLKSLGQPKGKAGKDYEVITSGGNSPYLSGGVSPLKAAAMARQQPAAPAPAAAAPLPAPGAYVTPAPVSPYAPAPVTGVPVAPAVVPAPAAPVAPAPAAVPWNAPAAPAPAPAPQVDPVVALNQAFQAGEYETMRDLAVGGVTYAIAAHRAGGKRILVRTVDTWDESQQSAALQGADALGADVLVVVAKECAPGARLASWGTKLQLVTPTEAAALKL